MTRETLFAKAQKNWHVLMLCSSLATALGFRWLTPIDRIVVVEKAVVTLASHDSAQDSAFAAHLRQGEENRRTINKTLDALALERCTTSRDILVRAALECGRRLAEVGR